MHPREVDTLGDALTELRGGGNTVVLVDHDPRLIERADHLVVLGPGAGRDGGAVVAAGPQARVRQADGAARLLGRSVPARARARRREPSAWMVVRQPTENNLSGEDVPIPLGVLAGMCGVSGSGKSTLAIDILARALAPVRLTSSVASEAVDPGAHAGIDGAPARTIHADQRRAGIRSPGAFLGVLGSLRRAYADSAGAAELGLGQDDLRPSCDACKGQGSVREDMGFLPPVEHPCDTCDGTGYRATVREVVVRGLSLPDLERLTIAEVLERWDDHDEVARPLRAASRLGLGYLALAQGARVLSGGERQRLKLARELARPVSRPTLYILDEPTTGLHALDVERLVEVLDGLVGQGHSVLVVDHDPALLASCDRLIELGPEGGPGGGRVVASGTPEEVAGGGTATAPYLREVLV
jgi:excinuclease ABC subunit A